jgi:hypothetical protein
MAQMAIRFSGQRQNTVPRWWMKSPNGFCDFLATLSTALLRQNSFVALAASVVTAATVVLVAFITVIVLSAVAVAAIVLVSLPPWPPRLPLLLVFDCCVLSVSTCLPPSLPPLPLLSSSPPPLSLLLSSLPPSMLMLQAMRWEEEEVRSSWD